MKSIFQTLIIACSLSALSRANCLIESEAVVGQAAGQRISNKEELEQLGSEDYIIHSFQGCEDGDKLNGLQFTVVSRWDSAYTVNLEPIGSLEGTCQTLALTPSGPISDIKASFSRND